MRNMEEECRAQNLPEWIGVITGAGKSALKRQFNHFTNKTNVIRARQKPIEILRNSDCELEGVFKQIAALDETLQPLRDGFSDTEKDTFSQMFFTQPSLLTLNFIPYFLTLLALCKCWIFPAMTMVMPFLSVIIPYFTMRFVYGINITIESYWNMISSMFIGDTHIKTAFNLVTFGATLAQSIFQPIQQSIHAQKTDNEIIVRGNAIKEYIQHFTQIRDVALSLKIYCPKVLRDLDIPDDTRQIFVYFYEYKHTLFVIDNWLGDLEVAYRFAKSDEICLADVYCQPASDKTFLHIENFFDPSVTNRVTNTVSLSGHEKGHAMLTGPNKGGKSTVLRSIALNCWLAQTFGVAFASSYSGSALCWIQTSLRLQDIPGQTSRFERECQGAQECLARKGRGIILVDELFHSTNPPDGEKASIRFLEKLWTRPNMLSIISTHMFALCESVPENVATICCKAMENEDLSIEYTYRLEKGICRLSSVEELLVKYGLGLPRVLS